MREPELRHYYDVMNNTKESVGNTLMYLASQDLDFSGENGEDYLWEDAKLGGFESNAKYALSIAEKENTIQDMIEKFIWLWMGRDSYYQDYDLGIIIKDDNVFISLAYTIGY